MSNINVELLKVLHIVFPAQRWRLVEGVFSPTAGTAQSYSRARVAEKLNRERAALEVKASRIQSVLDLLEPEEQP